jgi:hypothetical protein
MDSLPSALWRNVFPAEVVSTVKRAVMPLSRANGKCMIAGVAAKTGKSRRKAVIANKTVRAIDY